MSCLVVDAEASARTSGFDSDLEYVARALLVKYIGITSHNPENIMRALEAFDFDTVLLPVNYVLLAHPEPKNDYRPVLSLAQKRNLGIIVMKSIAKGPWLTPPPRSHNTQYQPFDTKKEVEEALRFALSQYVTTVTTSSDIQLARIMIDAAEHYTPLGEEKQEELILRASKYNPLSPYISPTSARYKMAENLSINKLDC